MDMRKSRVLRKIRNGQTAFSIKLNLSDVIGLANYYHDIVSKLK